MSHAIQSGYNSLSLIFALNWDRMLYVSAVTLALLLGGFLSAVLS